MQLRYKNVSFVMGSGERYHLLVDRETNVPLFHPNLFITSQIRNRSLSVSSMDAAATSINVLLTFCASRRLDLDLRLLKRQCLQINELDDLADFCQITFSRAQSITNIYPIGFRRRHDGLAVGSVGDARKYDRLTIIANYIDWLAKKLTPNRDDKFAKRVAEQRAGILKRRPSIKGSGGLSAKKGLSKAQVAALLEVTHPDSVGNPFHDPGVRIRNQLIVFILLYLGTRGGELLNLKIEDIDWHQGHIVIARRPDEQGDPRSRQPLVKTLDRRIPMKVNLVMGLHHYVKSIRKSIPGARKHSYLFVVHKGGDTQGAPLSLSAYRKLISSIEGASPVLLGLHGHLLRHTWNDEFSELMDETPNAPSAEYQETIRSYIQGWRVGSGSASTYTRRFVERKAQEAELRLQEKISRIPDVMKAKVASEGE